MDNTDNKKVKYSIIDDDTCYKIDVPDDIKEVKLKHSKVMIAEDLSFPNVETLVIEENVKHIDIKNTLFPNVKQVISYSPLYLSSKYLVKTTYLRNIIQNAFCQNNDSAIDLSGITSIDIHAFDDCKAANVINDEDIIDYVGINEKTNSAFFNKKPPKNGYVSVGNILVSVDERADRLDISKRICHIFKGIRFKNVKEMVIHDLDILHLLNYMPQKLIIADDTPYFGENNTDDIDNTIGLKQFYVSPKNEYFSTVDGVLFDKHKTTLIKYPGSKTGRYRVPDGVVNISKFAFANSEINHIALSDSVKHIGYGAFNNCKRLKSVDFGSGITTIGCVNAGLYYREEMFGGCESLKRVVIPNQVTKIGGFVFCNSGLEEVILSQNLEIIGSMAFANCKIKEIKLPKTLKFFGKGCLMGIEHIIMADNTDYETIANAIKDNSLDGEPKGITFTQNDESVYIQIPFFNKTSFSSIESIKSYEEFTRTSFVVGLIYYERYDSLLKMLNVNSYSNKELQVLLDIAEESEDITASAYILEKMGEKEPEKIYDI